MAISVVVAAKGNEKEKYRNADAKEKRPPNAARSLTVTAERVDALCSWTLHRSTIERKIRGRKEGKDLLVSAVISHTVGATAAKKRGEPLVGRVRLFFHWRGMRSLRHDCRFRRRHHLIINDRVRLASYTHGPMRTSGPGRVINLKWMDEKASESTEEDLP